MKLYRAAIVGVLFWSSAVNAVTHFVELKELDPPEPFCEIPMDLNVGRDYFVEIANPLPGKAEYNELVRLYRTKQWEKLETEKEKFRKIFENSPLVEAVYFLESQALFDQLSESAGDNFNNAEKKFRESLLLYPKSTLVPVLIVGSASAYLRVGLLQKALGQYERVLRDFPGHELSCVSLAGKGEVGYQLHDPNIVSDSFKRVTEGCQNPRVLLFAQLRAADKLRETNYSAARKEYEKAFEKHGAVINHYFPSLLYNLGEIKYRDAQYPSSRFFFSEFLKYRGTREDCVAAAYKRLADISFRLKAPPPEVIGNYLAVKDQMQRSDIGRYSYVHALLFDFGSASEPEQERRIKVVDAEIEKIVDIRLRERAFLEKGLALVEAGEKMALDYLVRLHSQSDFSLNKGELGNFVRERLLKILEIDSNSAVERKTRFDGLKDAKVFNPIESAFPVWLQGSAYESRARELYSNLAIRRYQDRIQKSDLAGALEKLERWKNSELWPRGGITAEKRATIGNAFVRFMMAQSAEALMDAIQRAFESRELLATFLEPDYSMVLSSIYRMKKESTLLSESLKKGERRPASLSPRIPKELSGYLWRETGLNYWSLKDFAKADQALRKVETEPYALMAKKDRLSLYYESKQYANYLKLGISTVSDFSEEERGTYLATILESYYQAKGWAEAEKILGLIPSLKLEGVLASQYYLAGARGQFEKGRCSLAIKNYTLGFALDEKSPLKVESKYRYGKCQLKERKKEFARKAWEEVVAANDSFWSPLAKTELKLLEAK